MIYPFVGNCIICSQHLYDVDGAIVDEAWDEWICYPHTELDVFHTTKPMLIGWAREQGATRPNRVATAMTLILNYYFHAPDSKPERTVIDAAMRALSRDRANDEDGDYYEVKM